MNALPRLGNASPHQGTTRSRFAPASYPGGARHEANKLGNVTDIYARYFPSLFASREDRRRARTDAAGARRPLPFRLNLMQRR